MNGGGEEFLRSIFLLFCLYSTVVKSSQVKSQRSGGFGGQLEYTRVDMRHLLRNFTQSVLPELGDGTDDPALADRGRDASVHARQCREQV